MKTHCKHTTGVRELGTDCAQVIRPIQNANAIGPRHPVDYIAMNLIVVIQSGTALKGEEVDMQTVPDNHVIQRSGESLQASL